MWVHERQVGIASDGRLWPADLAVPAGALGLVLFAHGSGSHRHSPRQRQLSSALNAAGLATLRVDLLTRPELFEVQWWSQDARAELDRLAVRLVQALVQARRLPETERLPQGLLGGGTGGAAALAAAARHPEALYAVVCRGGRTELVEDVLPQVRTPTLLVVGGNDERALLASQRALERMTGESALRLVPGAGPHLREPGALDELARLAADWFRDHFQPVSKPRFEGWQDALGRSV